MSAPKFSIITPSFNRADLIAEAIGSVQEQECDSVEHWVIDGNSTDHTPEVLARYPQLRVLREPDRGIYDALNKGLSRATGEIVGLLNTDDFYAPGIFGKVARLFDDPSIEAVHGGAEIYEGEGADRRVIRRFIAPGEIDLSWENVTVGVGTINARFWRRTFLEKLAPFDLQYRISSDRDFLVRAALLQPRAALLEEIVYYYRLHGDSLTLNHGEPRYRREHLTMATGYLSDPALPRHVAHWMRRLHTKETLEMAVTAGYRGDWRAGIAAAWRGFCVDRTWPVHLCAETARALARRVAPARISP